MTTTPAKHWTILIVPPGTGTARTIHVGQRARRALVGGVSMAGLLIASSIAVLFTPYASPNARILAAQNVRLQGRLDQIGERLANLSDPPAPPGAREQQIRLLAALPTETSSAVASAVAMTDSAGTRVSID